MRKPLIIFYLIIISLSLSAQINEEKAERFIGESASDISIPVRDDEIGLHLDNENLSILLTNFLVSGPTEDTVRDGAFEMLHLKYSQAGFDEGDNGNGYIRFSLLMGEEPDYTVLWRMAGTEKKTSGRFYLKKTGEVYLIEDWEKD